MRYECVKFVELSKYRAIARDYFEDALTTSFAVASGRKRHIRQCSLTCDVELIFNPDHARSTFLKRIRALNMASKVWHTEFWKSWDKHGRNDL